MSDDNLIDCFSLRDGWGRIPDPLGDFKSLEDALKANSYDHFATYGKEFGTTSINVHYNGTAFLVAVDTHNYWRIIWVPDFGSLVELSRQLSPMVQMAASTDLLEVVDDIHDLLTQYEEGPLADACQSRAHQRRIEAERRKARAAASGTAKQGG